MSDDHVGGHDVDDGAGRDDQRVDHYGIDDHDEDARQEKAEARDDAHEPRPFLDAWQLESRPRALDRVPWQLRRCPRQLRRQPWPFREQSRSLRWRPPRPGRQHSRPPRWRPRQLRRQPRWRSRQVSSGPPRPPRDESPDRGSRRSARIRRGVARRQRYAPRVIRELLEARSGEDYDLYTSGINPQFMRVLRTIGFDRVWARAEGQYLYDSEGNRFLDLLRGFGMFNVGRNNPRLRAAIVETLALETPGSVQLGVSLLPGVLADELLRRTPAGIGKVLFTSSGTEAVEAALKLGPRATASTFRPPVTSSRRRSCAGDTGRSLRSTKCRRASAARASSSRSNTGTSTPTSSRSQSRCRVATCPS